MGNPICLESSKGSQDLLNKARRGVHLTKVRHRTHCEWNLLGWWLQENQTETNQCWGFCGIAWATAIETSRSPFLFILCRRENARFGWVLGHLLVRRTRAKNGNSITTTLCSSHGRSPGGLLVDKPAVSESLGAKSAQISHELFAAANCSSLAPTFPAGFALDAHTEG